MLQKFLTMRGDNMNKNEFIQKALSNISDKYVKKEIELELTNHIDDRISFYVNAGYDEDIAQSKAIELMGNPVTVGSQMNQLHNNKKIKVASIILIVINILLLMIIYVFSLVSGFRISFMFIFLMASIIYFLLAKLKNPEYLEFFGFTEGIAVISCLFHYTEFFYFEDIEYFDIFPIAIEPLSTHYQVIVSVCSYISLVLIILCSLFSIGYGCYKNDELNGKVHTTLGRRFNNFSKFFLCSSIIMFLLPNVIFLISFLNFLV